MTPEMVEYYCAMLTVGIRDKLDAAFDDALETEEPLSDVVLSLSTCISDDTQVFHVLHHYTLTHTIDEQAVCDLVKEDVIGRYLAGEFSREDAVETLYCIAWNMDKYWDDPWYELTSMSYALELWQDGHISEETFNRCFDAWFFHGVRLDPWGRNSKPKK